MALSLPGERSIAAATPANPIRAFFAFLVKANADRTCRQALKALLELDAARLHDLGISHADIYEAMRADKCRSPGMVLSAARARAARP